VVPDETAGPFPGDGSNGADVLDDSGIVRQDIRSSFGTSTTTAAGVPLTLNLTVLDSSAGYAALEGVAVYAWHADGQGRYSMYSQGVENENYLRGVQPTDASGTASFTTAFPGCYDGRWPHIHFEVYRSTKEATSDGQIVKTSQVALPQAACETVYADTPTYPSSASNLARTSLTRDMVFGDDGGIHQLATVTGDGASGFVANLTIGV
jgi:protocatechuate 3,4-dioxygenase beta subunit